MYTIDQLAHTNTLRKFLQEEDVYEPNIQTRFHGTMSFADIFFEGSPMKDTLHYRQTNVIAGMLLNIIEPEDQDIYPIRLGYALYFLVDTKSKERQEAKWKAYLRTFHDRYQGASLSLDSLLILLRDARSTDQSYMKVMTRRWKDLISILLLEESALKAWCQELLYAAVWLYGLYTNNVGHMEYYHYELMLEVVEEFLGPVYEVDWEDVKNVELLSREPFWLLLKERWSYAVIFSQTGDPIGVQPLKRLIQIHEESVDSDLTRALYALRPRN